MKNSLKFVFLFLFLASVTLNLSSFSTGTDDQNVDEHILVEIYEVPEYADKGIHIHYGDDNTELIRFLDFDLENHSKNGQAIVSAINKLERDGYDLTHVSSGLAMNGMITKIWMIKRK